MSELESKLKLELELELESEPEPPRLPLQAARVEGKRKAMAVTNSSFCGHFFMFILLFGDFRRRAEALHWLDGKHHP